MNSFWSSGKNLSYRMYYVWLRNLISYKRFVVPTLLVSLGEPLFYLIAMGLGLGAYMGVFGGESYLHFLTAGIVVTAVMISSTFEGLYGSFVRMIHEKLYDSLIVTPLSAEDVVAGDILWAATRGLISGFLMLIVAFLLGVPIPSFFAFFVISLLLIIVGILFASLALIITAFAPNFDFFSYYSELVISPMFFFSGVFFPLDRMPEAVKIIAQFFPLTHAVEISRAIFRGQIGANLAGHFLILIIPTVIAFYLGIFFMKKRLIK